MERESLFADLRQSAASDPLTGINIAGLLHRSEQALYLAKKDGRNRIFCETLGLNVNSQSVSR